MNSIEATNRSTKTKGDINKIRAEGMVPGIIYGGTEENKKISLSKKQIKVLLEKENFLSNIIKIKIEGKDLEVLPRDISYHTTTDEPVHIDFLRIVKGAKIILEIPVKFINSEKSTGIKRGGVLNIVRRKVELKCPSENIPDEIVVDLDNTEINSSLKISSVTLPNGVTPTITDRDFVIGTVVAPTILVEPEKTEEASVEGEAPAEGAAEGTAEGGVATPEEGKEKAAKPSDDKGKEKSAKPSDDKSKAATKEPKKKII